MDKVSVIIPTYNRSDFIDKAINSVLNQTYSNIEIIIVDDNGKDTPARKAMTEKMRKYEEFSNIRYLKNIKNMGGALARNVGIQESSGQYITFLDDDDEYLPNKVEVQYSEMKRYGWEVSIMDGATYNLKGELLSKKRQKISQNPSKKELIRAHLMYHLTNTNTFMFKSDSLKSIGGFVNIVAGQEYMLMLKTIEADLKFGYIPQALVACYIHDNERLSTGAKKLEAEKILINEKKRYFKYLTRKEQRQVLCRHHGVLFYVQLKMRKYFIACIHAITAFIYSPNSTYNLFLDYKGKLK